MNCQKYPKLYDYIYEDVIIVANIHDFDKIPFGHLGHMTGLLIEESDKFDQGEFIYGAEKFDELIPLLIKCLSIHVRYGKIIDEEENPLIVAERELVSTLTRNAREYAERELYKFFEYVHENYLRDKETEGGGDE